MRMYIIITFAEFLCSMSLLTCVYGECVYVCVHVRVCVCLSVAIHTLQKSMIRSVYTNSGP